MYRTIYTQLWTDPKIRPLSKDGKLLFLYLITNPYTHVSGIYHLPDEVVIKQTGISDTLSNTLWDTLSDTVSIAYRDRLTSTVFVVNMFGYQGKGEKNERSAAHHLETLHHSALIPRFLERYPSVKQWCSEELLIPYRYPIDTPSESGKRCPSVPDPVLLTSPSEKTSDIKSKKHSQMNGRNYKEESKVILAFLNEKTGKHFREVEANLAFIEARLKSNIDVQTCKSLIARKVRDWATDPDYCKYLRPETLFNKTKFESYLSEVTP